ncbi:general odorant-binding protein 72-like [Diabrotica undecimpunctata]|uniref:general odorant-binding protein 72-like n=1 Tax=Diabrotica undecimpunctata TaxID=50387 RepID=UPI003B6328D4
MPKMKYLFLLLCLFIFHQYVAAYMTEKQIEATKKLIRNTCTNKQGVAKEKVDGMQKGDFDFNDKNAMCYLHCVLMTYKLMKKDNTFDWEEGLIVLKDKAPPSIGVPASASFSHCKDSVKTKEHKCTAAMEIAKCLYDFDPPNYFLP